MRVTPSFTSVSGTMSAADHADYAGITYAVAPGDAVPSPSANPPLLGLPVGVGGLAMGTDYTLAVWTHDRNGNVSEPVLDQVPHRCSMPTPPGPVTGLAATGGAYRADATWTPPTDEDVKNLQVTLVDLTRAVTGAPTTLPRTATGTGWPSSPAATPSRCGSPPPTSTETSPRWLPRRRRLCRTPTARQSRSTRHRSP